MKTLAFALGILLTVPAFAAENAPAPGDVPYLSGGIGSDERDTLKAEAKNYNLRLNFAEKGGGHFLSDVKVDIATSAGKPVLSATAAGPWFFAPAPRRSLQSDRQQRGQGAEPHGQCHQGPAQPALFLLVSPSRGRPPRPPTRHRAPAES